MNPVYMLLACHMFSQAAHSGISCGKSVRSCRVLRSLFSSRVPALQQIAIRCACMFDLLAFTALFHLPLMLLDVDTACVAGEVHSDAVPHHLR